MEHINNFDRLRLYRNLCLSIVGDLLNTERTVDFKDRSKAFIEKIGHLQGNLELSEVELKTMGFGEWTPEGHDTHYLIPLWAFPLLEDREYVVFDLYAKESTILKSLMDLDTRAIFLTYGIKPS